MKRRLTLASLQSHKVLLEPGKKAKDCKRVPRDLGNPHDIVQLADTYKFIRAQHGEKNYKAWVVKQAQWYGKKVPAYNG